MDGRIDLLNRESFVENVIKVVNQLSNIRKGCCFAIEGSWGIGKTFVIEEIENQLRVPQLEETNSDRYFVFHYNCWQHDYYEEPAVAIISAMLASIKEDEALISEDVDNAVRAGYEYAKDKIKEIAGLYIENKIGVNLISLADEIKNSKEETESAEWEFDKMFSFSQTIEKVRKKLQEIAVERTLVLFVDELDRCIPQYAIKVLERLHHIFYGLDNVIVIMAIDRKQLEHSVEEMFGVRKDESSIDIEKYLKKFIDFSMVLDSGRMGDSYWKKYDIYFGKFTLVDSMEIGDMDYNLEALFNGIDIRTQEKVMEKANMMHSLVCNKRVHISVLFFEILYEILDLYCFAPMNLALINDVQDSHLFESDLLCREKLDLLKGMEKRAWREKNLSDKKIACSNMNGKVFWYFGKIFNGGVYIMGKTLNKNEEKELEDGLKVAEKYCKFREIVK